MNKHTDHELKKMIENTQEFQMDDHLVHDGTEIKEAEPVTSRPSHRVGYRDLFANMPNGCAYYKVLFDDEKKPINLQYVKVNSAYEKNVGRPCVELIGKRVTEVFPHLTEGSFQWIKMYMKLAFLGEPVAFTQYFDHQDKWYYISAYSPEQDYVVEISEDVTKRKQNEAKAEQYASDLAEKNRELKISQSRYRGLLDHMHNIFEYHRVIADENGRAIDLEFAEVNPVFEMRTGLKTADVVGERLPVITHGIDKAYWIQVLGDVALTGTPIILEKYIESINTWYKVTAYSPEKGHVASILEDITAQKKIEIQKSEKEMQVACTERVASLGALAAGVAHQINQPLQALKILADGMVYWYDKGKKTSVEVVIDNCRRISVQVGYITTIVEWMQDFVNKAWTDTLAEVDLNQIIKQALNRLQARLGDHGIQLCENTCMVSPSIWGDSRRLEGILSIILVNAIESLDCVDQITKKILITTSCVGERAVLEISNNGPAIPDDIKEKIFEPFFSCSNSDANLGMGLAIVKAIVDAHDGMIQLSNCNQQVTFRIEFPLYVKCV